MLVLSRRIGEKIVIGGDIHVTVVALSGNQVRLGIMAPDSVDVARLELRSESSGADTPRFAPRIRRNRRSPGRH